MTMTRGYEALIILKTAGTDQELARAATGLEETVKKVGGSVQALQPMGRRRFSFRIVRQVEGHYYALRFTAPTRQIAELERLLRLNESIVRFIVLCEDELPTASAPKPAAASSQ